jgi:hypothetical protein
MIEKGMQVEHFKRHSPVSNVGYLQLRFLPAREQ